MKNWLESIRTYWSGAEAAAITAFAPNPLVERYCSAKNLPTCFHLFNWRLYAKGDEQHPNERLYTPVDAARHWRDIGYMQNRQLWPKRSVSILGQIKAFRRLKPSCGSTTQPLINIITRTSRRPQFFQELRQSVLNQTYQNIRHLVCSDDPAENSYLTDYQGIEIIELPRRRKFYSDHYPHNLLCNELIKRVNEGWILVLDDDDLLSRPDSLETIVAHIENEDDLLIWRSGFPSLIIPRDMNRKEVSLTEVTTCCCLVPAKHAHYAVWDEMRNADFRMISRMAQLLPTTWIDDVLTHCNYLGKPSSSGKGDRLDRNELPQENNPNLFQNAFRTVLVIAGSDSEWQQARQHLQSRAIYSFQKIMEGSNSSHLLDYLLQDPANGVFLINGETELPESFLSRFQNTAVKIPIEKQELLTFADIPGAVGCDKRKLSEILSREPIVSKSLFHALSGQRSEY